MIRRLVGFYVSAGTGAVRLAANVTIGGVKLVGAVAERAMGASRTPSAEPGRGPGASMAEAEAVQREPAPEAEAETQAVPVGDAESAPAQEPEPPLSAQPAVDYDASPPTPLDRTDERAKTVDEEPELVAEFAERGAEEGAGATTTVDEPWEGYREMNADAVIARIDQADLAELAMIELYEQAHRRRQAVLHAAEHRHRSLVGPGAR